MCYYLACSAMIKTRTYPEYISIPERVASLGKRVVYGAGEDQTVGAMTLQRIGQLVIDGESRIKSLNRDPVSVAAYKLHGEDYSSAGARYIKTTDPTGLAGLLKTALPKSKRVTLLKRIIADPLNDQTLISSFFASRNSRDDYSVNEDVRLVDRKEVFNLCLYAIKHDNEKALDYLLAQKDFPKKVLLSLLEKSFKKASIKSFGLLLTKIKDKEVILKYRERLKTLLDRKQEKFLKKSQRAIAGRKNLTASAIHSSTKEEDPYVETIEKSPEYFLMVEVMHSLTQVGAAK